LDFLLTDAVWAKAKIPKNNKSVHLWLGANIMVEYSFQEAKELLNRNLENANQNLRVFVSVNNFE
jgi:prefoldin subunit 5